jgi:hypothetical protein
LSVAVKKWARLADQMGPCVRLRSGLDEFKRTLREGLAVNDLQEDGFSPLRLRCAR